MTATTLRTANQILAHFRNHPGVRVIRACGVYEIWRCEQGALDQRVASYDLAELKAWAARW
jgi:hypothetical protein